MAENLRTRVPIFDHLQPNGNPCLGRFGDERQRVLYSKDEAGNVVDTTDLIRLVCQACGKEGVVEQATLPGVTRFWKR
jgi:hypothetical protein